MSRCARSATTCTTALSRGFTLSMRCRYASTTSTDDTSPRRIVGPALSLKHWSIRPGIERSCSFEHSIGCAFAVEHLSSFEPRKIPLASHCLQRDDATSGHYRPGCQLCTRASRGRARCVASDRALPHRWHRARPRVSEGKAAADAWPQVSCFSGDLHVGTRSDAQHPPSVLSGLRVSAAAAGPCLDVVALPPPPRCKRTSAPVRGSKTPAIAGPSFFRCRKMVQKCLRPADS